MGLVSAGFAAGFSVGLAGAAAASVAKATATTAARGFSATAAASITEAASATASAGTFASATAATTGSSVAKATATATASTWATVIVPSASTGAALGPAVLSTESSGDFSALGGLCAVASDALQVLVKLRFEVAANVILGKRIGLGAKACVKRKGARNGAPLPGTGAVHVWVLEQNAVLGRLGAFLDVPEQCSFGAKSLHGAGR